MINNTKIVDGNEAAASVAYRCNNVIGIYPITPSSPMAEHCEQWSNSKVLNVFGGVPHVHQMQSEGGAAGLLHGALMSGSLATSFTSSQGLLLMLPNMYKIAGELTPFALHVAARTVATHALSIFCDHSDVMAARQTGFAILAGNNNQQAHDFALIAQAATLKSRVPFLHFFDGFRTSHELNHIEYIHDDIIKAMLDRLIIDENYQRRLTPDAPTIKGTSQNPDTYFQAREAINSYYDNCPKIVIEMMEKFASLTGRSYQPFEYSGANDATDLLVIMGSASVSAVQAAQELNMQGNKTGVLCVHLFRPFSVEHCLDMIPKTIQKIAVLDRTKEPGAIGEPLYMDIVTALYQRWHALKGKPIPAIYGGRYGLSSKEFTPVHAASVFNALHNDQIHHNFTVGIKDDVTHLSLPLATASDFKEKYKLSAMFYGLGSDGTVGANKNTIKIIGNNTDWFSQGYFEYDSKKSGGTTISHLRFDSTPIDAPYLITQAGFIGCHQFNLLKNNRILLNAKTGATILFNAPYTADKLWDKLSHHEQSAIEQKNLTIFVIDATKLANECGIKGRINNIMQRAFFLLTDLIDNKQALTLQNKAIENTYRTKGEKVVNANITAVKKTESLLLKLSSPNRSMGEPTPITDPFSSAPEFVRNTTAELLSNRGNLLPVSVFPVDGAWPTGTSQWEKRNISRLIPDWEEDACTQCNICSLVCPHSAIRTKVVNRQYPLKDTPKSFKLTDYKLRDFSGHKFSLQVSPQDCTGCQLCVEMCPAASGLTPDTKALKMVEKKHIAAQQAENFRYFCSLPELKTIDIKRIDARSSQLLQPLFEFSGACSGCGETPYIKLLTQLYGEQMMIANATGCSSIYGGNLPTTPFTKNKQGKGPAWANSLFEDNAEFGLGMKASIDAQRETALRQLSKLADNLPDDLYTSIVNLGSDTSVKGIAKQQENIDMLKRVSQDNQCIKTKLEAIHLDALIGKSVWVIGGDGWAFDIGYGGLNHVLSGRQNINIIVLNNQVYANTGGQQSKATPTGAVAKFASEGKVVAGKDLGITTMVSGNAYVATIAIGANMNQAVKAIQEAEAFPGPSLIIAYASCITHGIDMSKGIERQKQLVDTGLWPLYRYNPLRKHRNKPALQLESGQSIESIEAFILEENRFAQLAKMHPQNYQEGVNSLQEQVIYKHSLLNQLADWK